MVVVLSVFVCHLNGWLDFGQYFTFTVHTAGDCEIVSEGQDERKRE